MNDFFRKNSSGKKVLLFVLLANLVYCTMVLHTIPLVMQHAQGMQLPDMMPAGYDDKQVAQLFNALGEAGRHAYLFRQIPVDMIYPPLFALAYGLLIAFLLKKVDGSGCAYLCWLPLLATFFDFAENLCLVFLLNGYPQLSGAVVRLACMATILKSALTILAFAAIFILAILFAYRKTRKSICP